MSHDDIKASEDHTGLKIELKDILDNLCDVLHLKKEDFENIFVHTLLWLDNKLIQLTKQRYSTPSPASSPLSETSDTPEVKQVKNNIFAILDNLY
nr:8313_t:CDS:2 [Entrophospora candida]